jgi:hypothetical protein
MRNVMFSTVLCLAAGASACVFNVDAQRATMETRSNETDWSVFHTEVTPPARELVIQGGHTEAHVEVAFSGLFSTTEGHLTLDRVLEQTQLSLERVQNALALRLEVPPEYEGVAIERITAWIPSHVGTDVTVQNAAVEVSGLTGPTRITTSNGPITVDAAGVVTLTTSNGPVTGIVPGGSVQTSNGPVELLWSAEQSLTVLTSNGGVLIQLQTHAGFHLDLETSNGAIIVESPDGEIVSGGSYQGSIGEGGPVLHVRTSQGPIRVQRAM